MKKEQFQIADSWKMIITLGRHDRTRRTAVRSHFKRPLSAMEHQACFEAQLTGQNTIDQNSEQLATPTI